MDDAALLQLWEAALPLAPLPRARLLARAAGAGERATLGADNRALLQLHQRLCGTALPLQAACPRCGTALEFTLDTTALAATAPAGSQPGEGHDAGHAEHVLSLGDQHVHFRLPCSDDLLGLDPAAPADAEAVARALFERCVLQARVGDRTVAAAELGADARQALARAIDELEPLACLVFDLACSDCAHSFSAPLDLAAVTFAELRHRAEQVLADVAALAHAFGWREADVLALTPLRRAAYLQLAGAEAGM
jgi:hypothetical protein